MSKKPTAPHAPKLVRWQIMKLKSTPAQLLGSGVDPVPASGRRDAPDEASALKATTDGLDLRLSDISRLTMRTNARRAR